MTTRGILRGGPTAGAEAAFTGNPPLDVIVTEPPSPEVPTERRGVYLRTEKVSDDIWLYHWAGWDGDLRTPTRACAMFNYVPARTPRAERDDLDLEAKASMQRAAREAGLVVDWSTLSQHDDVNREATRAMPNREIVWMRRFFAVAHLGDS